MTDLEAYIDCLVRLGFILVGGLAYGYALGNIFMLYNGADRRRRRRHPRGHPRTGMPQSLMSHGYHFTTHGRLTAASSKTAWNWGH